MTKHRINTVSKDCWWTPHIYSGFWASFNVSFCLDDHFVSRTRITDKLAGIFPHFLQVSALFWSNVFPVKLCKPSNICWPSRPWILRKNLFCTWLWTIILRNFWNPSQNALIAFCDTVLLSFPNPLWDTTQESVLLSKAFQEFSWHASMLHVLDKVH